MELKVQIADDEDRRQHEYDHSVEEDVPFTPLSKFL